MIEHGAIAELDQAFVRTFKPGDAAQRRRLAATGRPQQREERAVLQIEGDIAYTAGHGIGGVGENLGQVFDIQTHCSLHPRIF